MDTPTLDRIEIFPIKSLDGVVLPQVTVLLSGALQGDRQYAIFDSQGRFVNGKANPLVHQLRTTFNPELTTVTLNRDSEPGETFSLLAPCTELNAWLSHYFGQSVTVQANTEMGFPDDTQASGPTVISTATLAEIAQWFPDLDLPEIRRRFRTNLELAGVPAFWEEHLYGEGDRPQPFRIGPVELLGINPCQRCVVPTRNSLTGDRDQTFQAKLIRNRQNTLPDWVPRSRFNHFYKLAVNTRLATNAQDLILNVGDQVEYLVD
ncbi:MAG: MOSC N-terminal beta barrel domain-containing protein [Thermosynechococcaceae cyanobacterium]